MKHFITLVFFYLGSQLALGQAIVATPKNMYLIFNNPDSYFYLKVDGEDKSETDVKGMYIVDGKSIQIMTVKKNDFLAANLSTSGTRDILTRYYKFEKEYIDTIFHRQVEYTTEYQMTPNGREFIFWTYRPLQTLTESRTDTSQTVQTEIQLYVATEVGDLMVAASSPYFKGEGSFENLRKFLFEIIASITVSPNRINVYEFNKQVNN